MPEIDVEPIILQDCIIEIDGDDFAAAISTAELTPTASTVNFKGLKRTSTHTFPTVATWALNLTFAQDWVAPDSLSNYLFDNEGETKAAKLKPQSGVGPSFEVNVVITPGSVGGAVDTVAVSTITLGVSGRPERVPAVTP